MADDTSGFRFLVEQIQLRDKPVSSARDGGRGRETDRSARQSKPRQGAGELRDTSPRDEPREPSFLSRRWL